MFFDWLLAWQPEHVIGLITAIGILIGGATLKGTAKPAGAQGPIIDAAGTVHNAKLAPLDIQKIENILDQVGDNGRYIREINDRLKDVERKASRIDDRVDLIFHNSSK